jgi:penicillin-binding protein 1C
MLLTTFQQQFVRSSFFVNTGKPSTHKRHCGYSLTNTLRRCVAGLYKAKKSRGFNNASALLLNHKTMHIEAMIGSANFNDPSKQGQVNGTEVKRSPGSALKPFVYALAIDA